MKKRTSWRPRAVLVVFAIIASGLSALAFAQRSAEQEWQSTLVVGITTEMETFDPQINVTVVGTQRLYLSYESLLQYGMDGEILPLLATSWEMAEDGLTYTFQLRDDVKFSDGTPFDADSVAFAFERMFALERGPVSLFTPVESVEPLSEHVVAFHLSEPFPSFLAVMASIQARIFMSPTAIEANATAEDPWATEWAHSHSVGTGPYVLEEWLPEDRLVLTKNDEFRDPWADDAITRVEFRMVREPSTAVQMLMRGDVDVLETVPVQFRAILAGTPTVRLEEATTLGGRQQMNIFINGAKPPLDDVRVRQALSYGLDYERIIREGFDGAAVQARGTLPHSFLPWYSDSVFQYHHDPELAKQLLSEAGFEPGDIHLELVWRSSFTDERTIGQIVQSNLADIGVEVDLVEQTLPVWRQGIWNQTHDLFFFTQTGRYTDPDAIMYKYYHLSEIREGGFNISFANPRVDELLDSARQELDQGARADMYLEIQNIITENAVNLYIADVFERYAIRTYVSGDLFNPNYPIVFDANIMSKDPGAAR